jgi:hypothetical protein
MGPKQHRLTSPPQPGGSAAFLRGLAVDDPSLPDPSSCHDKLESTIDAPKETGQFIAADQQPVDCGRPAVIELPTGELCLAQRVRRLIVGDYFEHFGGIELSGRAEISPG